MCEPTTPTHVLLKQMKCSNRNLCDDAFDLLVYRFRSPFERYGRRKLGSEDASLATNDTFYKIYANRYNYEEGKCTCLQQECVCVELRARKYLWTIHEHTIIDWLRKAMRSRPSEILDETWLAPDTSDISPEAYVEARNMQEIVSRAWKSLSEDDRKLINLDKRPGRPNEALKQAQREARARFKRALEAALAEGGVTNDRRAR